MEKGKYADLKSEYSESKLATADEMNRLTLEANRLRMLIHRVKHGSSKSRINQGETGIAIAEQGKTVNKTSRKHCIEEGTRRIESNAVLMHVCF